MGYVLGIHMMYIYIYITSIHAWAMCCGIHMMYIYIYIYITSITCMGLCVVAYT